METLQTLGLGYEFYWSNERSIEIPMALAFIETHGILNLIEIGAVTPYFGKKDSTHWVVDLHDLWEHCIRQDALTFPIKDRNILSISTIEHIGLLDYETVDNPLQEIRPDGGILMLKRIVEEANHFLVTFPTGYNIQLDNFVKNSSYYPYQIFCRDSLYEWREDSAKDFPSYGRFSGGATAICVLQR